jgi:phosphate transport system protein
MPREHIVKSYDEEFDELKAKIAEMGDQTGLQLDRALSALIKRDMAMAEEVIKRDTRIDQLQFDIDDLTVRMLARRQPMALDLRIIVSGLKISADLERIADYAANIARHVSDLSSISLIKPIESIIEMAKVAQGMLKDSLESFRDENPKKATAAWHRDKDINTAYADLLAQLNDYIREDAENVKSYTGLIFVARCCERIGDHIKNIAESIYYIEYGEEFLKVAKNA